MNPCILSTLETCTSEAQRRYLTLKVKKLRTPLTMLMSKLPDAVLPRMPVMEEAMKLLIIVRLFAAVMGPGDVKSLVGADAVIETTKSVHVGARRCKVGDAWLPMIATKTGRSICMVAANFIEDGLGS